MGRLLHTWFQDLAGFWSVALPEANISEEAGRAGHLRRISGSSSRDRMWARSGENEGDCLLGFVFLMFVFLLSNSGDRGFRIWEARVPAYVALQAQGQDVGQVGGVSGGLLVGFLSLSAPFASSLGDRGFRIWEGLVTCGVRRAPGTGTGCGPGRGSIGGIAGWFLSRSAPFASSLGDRGFRIWEGLVTCGVRRAPGTGTGCGPGRGSIGGIAGWFLSRSAPFASSLGDRGFRIWEGLVTCGVRRAPGTGTGCGPGRGRTREGRCTRPG